MVSFLCVWKHFETLSFLPPPLSEHIFFLSNIDHLPFSMYCESWSKKMVSVGVCTLSCCYCEARSIHSHNQGCCGHRDMLDKRCFNWAALISVDGVWGGMLIWVIAYVNAQLGSSQCQNTSARVSECHPTLAPTQRVDRSDKHSPEWAVLC